MGHAALPLGSPGPRPLSARLGASSRPASVGCPSINLRTAKCHVRPYSKHQLKPSETSLAPLLGIVTLDSHLDGAPEGWEAQSTHCTPQFTHTPQQSSASTHSLKGAPARPVTSITRPSAPNRGSRALLASGPPTRHWHLHHSLFSLRNPGGPCFARSSENPSPLPPFSSELRALATKPQARPPGTVSDIPCRTYPEEVLPVAKTQNHHAAGG